MKVAIIFCVVFVAICGMAHHPPPPFGSHESHSAERFGEVYLISGRGFKHDLVPPFANGTSDAAKQQLKEIFKDRSLTKQQINEKVQEWVNSQDSSVQSAYAEFEAKRKEREEQMKSKIEGANLSEQATSALKQIDDVINDNSITIGDEHTQIRDILNGLTPEQRKEVKGMLHGNRPNDE